VSDTEGEQQQPAPEDEAAEQEEEPKKPSLPGDFGPTAPSRWTGADS
jgi:hypothetical protein